MDQRIFSGIYPAGIVYADRTRQKGGDYARLAFLPYDTLELEFSTDCPPELKKLIERDAEKIQSRAGQEFRVSTVGQTVLLGSGLLQTESAPSTRQCMRPQLNHDFDGVAPMSEHNLIEGIQARSE